MSKSGENEKPNIKELFPIFSSLNSDECEFISNKISWIDSQEGDTLFQQGAPGLGLYLLARGQVKLCRRTPAGKNIIQKIVGPGEMLGVPTFFNKEKYTCYAKVMQASKVGFMQRNELFDFLKDKPQSLFSFLSYLSTELVIARIKLAEIAYQGSKQRISRLLAAIEEKGISASRSELAQLTGVTYKTVIQVLQEMKDREIVEIEEGEIEIVDREALGNIADGFPLEIEGQKLL